MAKRKILIIDDDKDFISTVRSRLEFEGYLVEEANDGDAGFDVYDKFCPDLIILDIMMPKLNGYSFLKLIRKRQERETAIIICTANNDFIDILRGEGINGLLIKPFDPKDLLKMISVALKIQDTNRAKKAPPPTLPSEDDTTLFDEPSLSKDEHTFIEDLTVNKEPTLVEEPTLEDKSSVIDKNSPATAISKDHLLDRKPRILIIDDEESFLASLTERLAFEGMIITTATNGTDGLRMARKNKLDLIIVDVMIPGIDGYMICRLLKFDAKYSDIPVFIISARNLSGDRNLAMLSGADSYFTKPLDMNLLLQKIKKLFSTKFKLYSL